MSEKQVDNDLPEHRKALIAALRNEGLDAYEYNSGGGTMHVVVDLVNEVDGGLLQIATGSAASPCDVGLMGWNESGNVQSQDWHIVHDIPETVRVFRRLASERDSWVRRFLAGELNV